MRRGGPIRRKSPMKRKLARRLTRPGPGRDEAYLWWVRQQKCILDSVSCYGPIHAHHAGPKRMDRTAIPLCASHHDDWHSAAGNGYFGGWGKLLRQSWAAEAIGKTQELHTSSQHYGVF